MNNAGGAKSKGGREWGRKHRKAEGKGLRKAAKQNLEKENDVADFSDVSDEDLYQDIMTAHEAYSETAGQYYSEVALFGDAGPGHKLVVDQIDRAITELEAEWTRRHPEPLTEAPTPPLSIEDMPF